MRFTDDFQRRRCDTPHRCRNYAIPVGGVLRNTFACFGYKILDMDRPSSWDFGNLKRRMVSTPVKERFWIFVACQGSAKEDLM
jgi:hypothetical protein